MILCVIVIYNCTRSEEILYVTVDCTTAVLDFCEVINCSETQDIRSGAQHLYVCIYNICVSKIQTS